MVVAPVAHFDECIVVFIFARLPLLVPERSHCGDNGEEAENDPRDDEDGDLCGVKGWVRLWLALEIPSGVRTDQDNLVAFTRCDRLTNPVCVTGMGR